MNSSLLPSFDPDLRLFPSFQFRFVALLLWLVDGSCLVRLTLQLPGAASGAAGNLSLGEIEPKGRSLS